MENAEYARKRKRQEDVKEEAQQRRQRKTCGLKDQDEQEDAKLKLHTRRTRLVTPTPNNSHQCRGHPGDNGKKQLRPILDAGQANPLFLRLSARALGANALFSGPAFALLR